ncbi:MAG TPA: EAL domain-containing protein [Acidimicrobiales bacterium]|nr:EAL domain-containing protein [Acidimicrobiales bacterium]
MTVEVERASHHPGDGRAVSGPVVKVLMGLVHAHGGDVGVAQALALAGEGRSFLELNNPATRSTLAETVALFNAAALVIGDGAIGLHVGDLLLSAPGGDDFVDWLQALGSPGEVFRHVEPLVAQFETTSEAEALEVADDHALVQVVPLGAPSRHAHLCEMTRGLLSRVPALWGLGPTLVTETECSARGGRRCLYALSWDDDPAESSEVPPPGSSVDHPVAALQHGSHNGAGGGPSPGVRGSRPTGRPDQGPPAVAAEAPDAVDGRGAVDAVHAVDAVAAEAPDAVDGRGAVDAVDATVAELRAELDKMEVLVEGASATALELLDDDVDSLLTQIAARADAVVSADRYLLMVRVRPGTPVQLHNRGLGPDEAQDLAVELWRDHADDAGGSRLIVDIASRRHRYGRLVEFLPPGAVPPPSESRLLGLYAEYAATALDVFGVISESKRSDATARTLLSFSEALSRVTTLSELVQLLADTIPEVTDCDQSTVYLWESDLGQLTPRARTVGAESPPEAYVGPIVPVLRPGQTSESPRPGPAGDTLSGSTGSPSAESSHRRQVGEASDPLVVPADLSLIDRLINQREVIVLDETTDDPLLLSLMDRSQTAASVVAPLFAAGEFLGVIAANFGTDTPLASIRDADLHERLSGLADQAATALQNLGLIEKVSHMAWHDALTGLPNRRLFKDRVEQELVRSRRVGEPVCMFFVDLDHLKSVNDTLGHAAGDDLIQLVSDRLVDTVREQDTVARVGGDEFAILLPGLSDQLAIDQLAQRSLEAMSAPFLVFGQEVETSASIGIAMAPDHGDTYDELLSRADEAMYRAKARGRNAFQMYSGSMVDPDQGRLVIDERTLYTDLVHAIEHDEFFILYQPYIDLRTAEVVGVEALVRWHHPTHGTLEPAAFISMAEKSDIIVALDTWVLEETCRQARAWLDRGLAPLRLSVNLASRDLSNPDLFANIDRALEETGIDPSLLELEITERVVLDKTGPAKANIERLRRLGVRFTIDDFGTGNSSLSRIGSFPVSTLKIDQSFVQVLGPDGDNNSLVAAIISMADRLGLDCVAEGVETSLQSRVLLQRGCNTAQGYFFSPPLPAEDIERMMAGISSAHGPTAPGDR